MLLLAQKGALLALLALPRARVASQLALCPVHGKKTAVSINTTPYDSGKTTLMKRYEMDAPNHSVGLLQSDIDANKQELLEIPMGLAPENARRKRNRHHWMSKALAVVRVSARWRKVADLQRSFLWRPMFTGVSS
jgi:hypothetical protein